MRNFANHKLLLPLAALVAMPAFAATNLVQNGDFEQSSGVGQLAQNIATTAAWTVGATLPPDAGAAPFVFIVDDTADDGHHNDVGGFRSVFHDTYGWNVHVYGPGNGHANGFSSSVNGGHFLGADAAYANAPISQTISGLTAGHTYTLSFEYASAQFTDADGDYHSGWNVDLGGSQVGSVSNDVASHGFAAWKTFSTTFTASTASSTLTFLATGGPTGLPPFSLLDGVSITENIVTPPPPVPEPASVALLLAGAGVVGLVARRRNGRSAA